ncbi:uncharacterized protein DUF4238 [Panacagrimonas perspica]|uniref:Uncharacterized protein DUF4238 n=1 Tax=Panacagrimonas perspica TaxID=381431 RepID=A0A4R7PEC8_9GAMM|nr:DUF4238 domain-containing protein [Panacagrimonas perspica]TDU32563.1 uncharacterized protein DUF4238 [Panacagrimonas perspica]THD05463.1 hypothetical protein B1810_01685 [Panacagrimonas perspica]
MTAPKSSSPKEHHFVPKFYLRRFSKNGKQIHAFNFDRGRVIPNASIKGQCSRRNFHGFAPGIEEELSKLEETTSRIIRKVCEDVALPPQGSDDRLTLLTFLVFQKLRTGRSASVSRMLSDYYDTLVHGSNPPDPETAAELAIMRQYPVAIPLSVAPDMVPVAARLQMQLLLNKTRRPFLSEFSTADGTIWMTAKSRKHG